MNSTKTPRAAPRDRSGPAQPTEKALARSARGRKAVATRNDPWTRVQDSKLLAAYIQNKTGQELADAVGGGRTAEECQDRLHGKHPLVPKRLLLAYAWDPAKPLKHSAVFRAALTEEERNMSEPQLKKLWLKESQSTCIKAVKSFVNCDLGGSWGTKPNCARILSKAGLHPAFLDQRPSPRLTTAFTDRRKDLIRNAESLRQHRETCLKLLAAETKVNLEDLNDDEFEKRDKRAYDRLRWKAACGDALADDADAETQMPTKGEIPEISQRTVSPPFEPVPVDARLSNPAFARQFRRHDQSFDLITGRSGCTCPSRAPPNPSVAVQVVGETLRRENL